jgi:hypothetical protein
MGGNLAILAIVTPTTPDNLMKPAIQPFFAFLLLPIFFAGCGEEKPTSTDNVPKDYESPLKWSLPAGWSDTGQKSEMVIAKLSVGAGDEALECSISSFEGNGGTDLENLNRWLRQLGRDGVDAQGLANLRKNLFLGLHNFLYFDLTQDDPAPADKQFLTAILRENNRSWFFKLSGPRDPLRSQDGNFKAFLASIRLQGDPDNTVPIAPATAPQAPLLPSPGIMQALSSTGGAAIPAGSPLPPGAPPPPPSPPPLPPGGLPPPPKIPPEVLAKIKARQAGFAAPNVPAPGQPPVSPVLPSAPVPNVSTPKWTVPEGWKELPASGMRKGNFSFGDGNNPGEVTVIPLPSGAGSLGANIKRWAGQVGITDEAFQANPPKPEATQIGGKPSWFIPLRGEKDTILTGMADHGGQTWFFKMKGSNDLVKSQEAAFQSFLQSVRF